MAGSDAPTLRLFVALPVPPTVRAQLSPAVGRLRDSWPDARWTDPAGWHLTLAFLGPVPHDRLDDLITALRRAAAAHNPVEVAVPSAADTPGGRRGIVWLPVPADPALDRLAEDVRDACQTVGADPDRAHRFRGHITLCRLPRGTHAAPAEQARRIAEDYVGPDLRWTADAVELIASVRHRRGATYRTEATLPLTA